MTVDEVDDIGLLRRPRSEPSEAKDETDLVVDAIEQDEEMNVVKWYQLTEQQEWEDRGTGQVRIDGVSLSFMFLFFSPIFSSKNIYHKRTAERSNFRG